MTIKVAIADDHPVVRSGISAELNRLSDIEVVGTAANGAEVLQVVETLRPDVLILDINMPCFNPFEVTRRIRTKVNILILTVTNDMEYVMGLLEAGAKGYLLKEEDLKIIIDGIRAVAKGQIWLSGAILQDMLQFSMAGGRQVSAEECLSPREFEVLCLMARGYRNGQIAEQLVVAPGTVRNHVSNLYTKLNVHTRAEAVAWAWQNGILEKSGFTSI